MQNQVCRGVATKIWHDTQGLHCQLYSTVVFTLHKGVVTLNSGGWRTATTKLRMNQALNQYCFGQFQVFQRNFDWFILNHRTVEVFPFKDGIELHCSGSLFKF